MAAVKLSPDTKKVGEMDPKLLWMESQKNVPMDLSFFPLRALSDRSYVLGKTKPSGGKAAKERLTFMVTTNYTGSTAHKYDS